MGTAWTVVSTERANARRRKTYNDDCKAVWIIHKLHKALDYPNVLPVGDADELWLALNGMIVVGKIGERILTISQASARRDDNRSVANNGARETVSGGDASAARYGRSGRTVGG